MCDWVLIALGAITGIIALGGIWVGSEVYIRIDRYRRDR